MAQKMFDLKMMDLFKLRNFYKKAPKQFGYTTASLLNTFAFKTRRQALKVIDKQMTVRNQSFVVSHMRFRKTNGRLHINQQESSTFSTKGKRFSGWQEQETGRKPLTTKTTTMFSRGSMSEQVKPKYRMKPGRDFPKPEEYEGRDKESRVEQMLHELTLKKYKKPFIIHGSNQWGSGLYVFARKKIEQLQNFSKNKKRPRRTKWMTKAKKNMFASINLREEWGKAIDRTIKFK